MYLTHFQAFLFADIEVEEILGGLTQHRLHKFQRVTKLFTTIGNCPSAEDKCRGNVPHLLRKTIIPLLINPQREIETRTRRGEGSWLYYGGMAESAWDSSATDVAEVNFRTQHSGSRRRQHFSLGQHPVQGLIQI